MGCDMNRIRSMIAAAMGIPVSELGCFTLVDHDGSPSIVVLHGPEKAQMWVEDPSVEDRLVLQKEWEKA